MNPFDNDIDMLSLLLVYEMLHRLFYFRTRAGMLIAIHPNVGKWSFLPTVPICAVGIIHELHKHVWGETRGDLPAFRDRVRCVAFCHPCFPPPPCREHCTKKWYGD